MVSCLEGDVLIAVGLTGVLKGREIGSLALLHWDPILQRHQFPLADRVVDHL